MIKGGFTMILMHQSRIEKLSDASLLRDIESLAGQEKATTLEILLHLNEVEKRSLHLSQGYASLFDYCTRHLRYSESAAMRRIRTARCIRDYPRVFELLKEGDVTLTTVSMIAGIVTPEIAETLLYRIAGKSQRDVGAIVSVYRPKSRARERVTPVTVMKKPLGPGLFDDTPDDAFNDGLVDTTRAAAFARTGSNNGVADVWASWCAGGASGGTTDAGVVGAVEGAATVGAAGAIATGATGASDGGSTMGVLGSANGVDAASLNSTTKWQVFDRRSGGQKLTTAGGERDVEQRYNLDFTVSEEVMAKIEKVKSLLSGKHPRGVTLESVFETMMDEYLDRHSPEKRLERREKRRAKKLEKSEKLDKLDKPDKPGEQDDKQIAKENGVTKENGGPAGKRPERSPSQTSTTSTTPTDAGKTGKSLETEQKRTRHVPAKIRDAVFKRDGGKCAFVGTNGKRCNSTWGLQIDHIEPFARGGGNTADNLRLLCARHNRFAAEQVYGKGFMEEHYQRE